MIVSNEFYEKFKEYLSVPRGGGLWLWKPYIIRDAMSRINSVDIDLYCDLGACFIRNIKKSF